MLLAENNQKVNSKWFKNKRIKKKKVSHPHLLSHSDVMIDGNALQNPGSQGLESN
jgi:hypothetical protein